MRPVKTIDDVLKEKSQPKILKSDLHGLKCYSVGLQDSIDRCDFEGCWLCIEYKIRVKIINDYLKEVQPVKIEIKKRKFHFLISIFILIMIIISSKLIWGV